MVDRVLPPQIGNAFGQGFDAAQRNRLADAANVRAENMLDLDRERFDWRQNVDQRNYDFQVEGRDFQREQARKRAAQAAANAARRRAAEATAAERQQDALELKWLRTLPEDQRALAAAQVWDGEELAAARSPEGRMMLSDMAIDAALVGYGEMPPQPEPYQPQSQIGKEAMDRRVMGLPAPSPEPGYTDLPPEEVARRGLPDGFYQRGPEGKIYKVGGGGVTVNVGDEAGAPEMETSGPLAGTVAVPDPASPSGQRVLLVPGTPVAQAAVNTVAQAQQAIDVAEALVTYPDLERFIGPVESRLPNTSAEAREFQRLFEQFGGQAFLQAREPLKGTGVISDTESLRAETAASRLSMDLDPPAFRRALNDFISATSAVTQQTRQALERSEIPEAGSGRGVVIGGERLGNGSVFEANGRRFTVRGGLVEDEEGRMYNVEGDALVPAY